MNSAMEITTATTPMPTSIEQALQNLLPTQAPTLSDEDLNYLANVTPQDLMEAAFPNTGEVIHHKRFLRMDGSGNTTYGRAFAWSKRSGGTLFILARRTLESEECMLVKVPFDRSKTTESIRDALDDGSATGLLKQLREQQPPSCLISYHPTVNQGLVALDRSHSDGAAIEKILEALVLHAQIGRSALETVSGLAQRLLHLQPAAGALKLQVATDPSNLDRARTEARHAIEQCPQNALRKPDDSD